ncbi:hypothetical protein PPL_05245 [Heterostelium album PN500]|uniref:Uncharacterized protein n=1 Tax=Heterostelium pallidum (strain ATCC 26659 / Pp 5 / PN500) TaxID=670386 RepID=D3B9U8_HETP5|nr:hypothetical protein PPL_05245 [Heterostelium album PN500]EFA82010.1 hypothetical protein PPL_05245 [Heterostelium album PN500]|eukprot:XP_020434127.1 hypothetical protein PPL_05245 [Heterostelium album PN500]
MKLYFLVLVLLMATCSLAEINEQEIIDKILAIRNTNLYGTPQKYTPPFGYGAPGYGAPGFQPWSGTGFEQGGIPLLAGLFSGNSFPYPFNWLGGGGAYIGGYSGAVPPWYPDHTPNGKYIGGGNWDGYLAGYFPIGKLQTTPAFYNNKQESA